MHETVGRVHDVSWYVSLSCRILRQKELKTCSDQCTGEVLVQVRSYVGVRAEARGLQVLHDEQINAPRGETRRVDPAQSRVVGTAANI